MRCDLGRTPKLTNQHNGHAAPQTDAAGSNPAAERPWLVPHRWQPGRSGNAKGSSASIEKARAAIRALAAEHSKAAFDTLVALLDDEDARVRAVAAKEILGLIGLPAKVEDATADKGVTIVVRNFELEKAEEEAAAAGRPPSTIRTFGPNDEVTETEGTE
jgi:hypothetical protein